LGRGEGSRADEREKTRGERLLHFYTSEPHKLRPETQTHGNAGRAELRKGSDHGAGAGCSKAPSEEVRNQAG